MALMCTLFPAIIFCCVRNKLTNRKLTKSFNDIIFNILEYLCGNVMINFLIIGLRYLVLKKNDNVWDKLNLYTDFAIKYLIIALVLAVILPLIEKWIRNNVIVSFKCNHKIVRLSEKAKSVIVYILAVIFAGHHIIRLFDNSIWGDEGIVVMASRKSFMGMLYHVAHNGHAPLHYSVAWFFVRIFGENGWVYHLSATLSYLILMFVIVIVIKKWFGNKSAMIMLVLCTFLENAIKYNLEIRMYAWCELFVLLTYLMAYKLLNTNKTRYYILMALASVGAVYSHYFALGGIGLLYFIILIYNIIKEKKSIWKVVLSGGSVLAILAPWLIYAKKVKGEVVSNYGIGQVKFKDCVDYIFYSKYSRTLLICFFIAVIIALIYEIGLISIKKEPDTGKKISIKISTNDLHCNAEFVWIIGGIIAVFGTIGIAELISNLMYPIIVLRYLYILYVILWLLFAVAISKLKLSKLWTILLIAVVLITCYPTYVNVLLTERTNNARLEKTLAATQPQIDENDCIYTDIVHFAWTVENVYYPSTDKYLFGMPQWWGPNELPELDDNKEYWLFISTPITEKIENNLDNQNREAKLVVNRGFIGTGDVWVYKIIDK